MEYEADKLDMILYLKIALFVSHSTYIVLDL
jgi:hypothetical protein